MSLKNWSTTAASNTSAPPNGAPENTTLLKDMNDIMRQVMADTRTLAASDTIASATSCDLGSKDATFLTVGGTTTITGLGTVSAGIWKAVTFSGALTLTHNATSLILPGAANITTTAGDTALFLSLGSGNWKCMMYQDSNTQTTGTWTPTVGGTATYTTQTGTYTKIGKNVFLRFDIAINVLGTGSATNITGLPFTEVVGNALGSPCYFTGLATSVYGITPLIAGFENQIKFTGLTASATSTTLPITVFANGTRIIGQIDYTIP